MRNSFFDVLKFLAIMLVVYGHVAGAFGCHFGQPWLDNFIVGMNMSLFFVVSGYFAAKGTWILRRWMWGVFDA